MRTIRVYPPAVRTKAGVVHRVQFDATGRELVAWVEGHPNDTDRRMAGVTSGLYAHDLDANSSRSLLPDGWFDNWGQNCQSLVVSSDLRFLAAPMEFDEDGYVWLGDLHTNEWCLDLPLPDYGLGELIFTVDAKELIAVRNITTGNNVAPDVARFEMRAFTEPPTQFEEGAKPFRVPVRDLRWERVCALPRGSVTCAAALSPDGQLFAVGTEDTTVHVVDLKRKRRRVSLPWEERQLRYTAVTRVTFDPPAEWVVVLASGRLLARRLSARSGAGTAWHTKTTLGNVLDFAFHPTGRFLCAVCADGQARYLDAHTGTVQQSFKWVKKPKSLYSVAFSPDGLTCAAGSENGQVVLWDVDA